MAFSLLWKDNEVKVSELEKTVFTDLKIEKLLDSLFDNYNDVDEMLDIMKFIPTKNTLLYRQEIFTDLLNDNNQVFEALYYELIDLTSRYISYKEATENIKRKVFFIIYLHHYYDYLEKVKSSLVNLNVQSSGLKDLITKISNVLVNNEVINKRTEIDSFYDYIMSHLTFNAEFHDGAPYFKLSFNKIRNLEDDLINITKKLDISIIKSPRQIMKREINPYFLHEIAVHDPVCFDKIQVFFEENRNSFINDLTYLVKEFKYYLSLKQIFTKVSNMGISYCKATINDVDETIINDAYDVSLTVSKINVIPNDYYSCGKENISFVLGVNSGGKTCYLRSVASNYVFFMTIGYMFSKSAKVYPVKNIFTHFPNEENYSFGEGRLRDEIKRLDIIKESFGPDCIAFLNETFSSTSEEKAYVLTKKLLADIGESQTKIMFVTHQYKIFEEILDTRISFYTPVVEEGETNVRTHKIRKVEKKLLSYVDDILYKYGLTKAQLLERRKENHE